MPKYIDAEALKAAVSAYCDKTKPCSTISVVGLIPDVVIRDVLDIIDAAPAADVVEVVRCRDCCMHGNCYMEEVFDLCRMPDGFCCVGKMRDDDERP